jgi:hypothetical protein
MFQTASSTNILLSALVTLPAIAYMMLLLGERSQYRVAELTLDRYNTSAVCAIDRKKQKNNFTSVRDHIEAKIQNKDIVHCGECGHCSTVNDIEIMKSTKDTLTKEATGCALKALFYGEKSLNKCLEEKIGFTQPCSSCWKENILCSRRNCKFTCLLSIFLGEKSNVNGGSLNSCLECDEKLCGPEFIQCAGANRRRLGIETDIKRDKDQEQCHLINHEVEG